MAAVALRRAGRLAGGLLLLRALSSGAAVLRRAAGAGLGSGSSRAPAVVWVKVSDVAACIGRNQYKPASEVLDDMHKRYSAETFLGSTKLDLALEAVERLPVQEKELLLKAAALPLTSATEVKQVLTSVTQKITSSEVISETDKLKVVSLLTGTMQTGLGTRTEATIVQAVEAEQKVVMERDVNMYSLPLCKVGETTYALRGRIDRLQQEGDETILIEIKARVNRLFKKLRDYEKIQVQCYLQMLPPDLAVRRARLIEQFNGESHSIDLDRDDALWQNEILPGLVDFCNKLDAQMKGGGAK